MLLLPKMPLDAAQQRGEDWRRRFAAMSIPAGGRRVATTVSIGIAEFPTHGRTGQELIACADQALFQAKSAGRDRVVSYQPAVAR